MDVTTPGMVAVLATGRARYPTPEQVIQAADKALYRAKKAGRNQVKT